MRVCIPPLPSTSCLTSGRRQPLWLGLHGGCAAHVQNGGFLLVNTCSTKPQQDQMKAALSTHHMLRSRQ